MFAPALLTGIPQRLRVVRVSANKTSAYHVRDARFTRASVMHVSLRSIPRGRARGPPTALSHQFGLGRRFLGNARFPAGLRGRRSGSGAASGHQYQRGFRGEWIRAPPPGCTRSCGPSVGCSPAVSSRRSLAGRSSFHLTGHFCRGPDCSSRSSFSPGSATPPTHQRQRTSVEREWPHVRCFPAQPSPAQSADER